LDCDARGLIEQHRDVGRLHRDLLIDLFARDGLDASCEVSNGAARSCGADCDLIHFPVLFLKHHHVDTVWIAEREIVESFYSLVPDKRKHHGLRALRNPRDEHASISICRGTDRESGKAHIHTLERLFFVCIQHKRAKHTGLRRLCCSRYSQEKTNNQNQQEVEKTNVGHE